MTGEDADPATGWDDCRCELDPGGYGVRTGGTTPAHDVPLKSAVNGTAVGGTPPPVSTDATLSGLAVNDGSTDLTLTPTFVSGTYAYAASVGNTVTEVTVTPMKNDSGATIEYLDASDMTLADAGTEAGQQVTLGGWRQRHKGEGDRRGRLHHPDLRGDGEPGGPAR